MGEDFPALPAPSLSPEIVAARCLELKAEGWEVFRDGARLVVKTGATSNVTLTPDINGQCHVSGRTDFGAILINVPVHSLEELDEALRQRGVAGRAPRRDSTRTRQGEPASNIGRIAGLMRSRVEGVYDPYLDDRGLATLVSLVGLGHGVAPDVRLVTSLALGERLTQAFVAATVRELRAPHGLVRRTTSPKPHRRFMLLSGGQSLILGMSLNDLDKDEAARIEPDTEDRPFFDREWGQATPL